MYSIIYYKWFSSISDSLNPEKKLSKLIQISHLFCNPGSWEQGQLCIFFPPISARAGPDQSWQCCRTGIFQRALGLCFQCTGAAEITSACAREVGRGFISCCWSWPHRHHWDDGVSLPAALAGRGRGRMWPWFRLSAAFSLMGICAS